MFLGNIHIVLARKEAMLIQYHVTRVRDGFRNDTLAFKEN